MRPENPACDICGEPIGPAEDARVGTDHIAHTDCVVQAIRRRRERLAQRAARAAVLETRADARTAAGERTIAVTREGDGADGTGSEG